MRKQTPHDPENGVIGDCFRCCIAFLVGEEIENVPHFVDDGTGRIDVTWRLRADEWLGTRHLALIPIVPNVAPLVAYLAVGPTIRSKTQADTHCVIMRGHGEHSLIYDPHTDDAGLLGVTHAYLIVPTVLNAWRLR